MNNDSNWSQRLCDFIVRHWITMIVLWGVACAVITVAAPPFSETAAQGEFGFLPPEVPSLKAETVFQEAFDKDLLRSLVVINVRRTTRPDGLTSAEDFSEQDRSRKSDYDFIENDLKPALIHILKTLRHEEDWAGSKVTGEIPFADAAVTTYTDRLLGPLLVSHDKQASLVIVELPNDFLDVRNAYLMEEIEKLLYDNPEFRSIIPPGLEITMSGTATVGRDMNLAAFESAKATEKVTIVLVIILLLAIYRAPILAIIPLLTVMIVIQITLSLIALLASWNIMGTFESMDIYIIVVVYGAGVDYCLFLIARYREELENGIDYQQAIASALKFTSSPLIGSAGTSIIGIGMMVFTEYKKFQQVGLGISLGLAVGLIAALTLTPALLRIFGKWSFWPNIPQEHPGESPGWISQASLMERLVQTDLPRLFWKRVSAALIDQPGLLWLFFTALMMPFVVIALMNFNHLSYGLLSELPENSRSVVGSRAVQEHFPAGRLGPTTVLLVNKELNFLQENQVQLIKQLSDRLYAEREQLGLLDVFSSAYPLGMTEDGLQLQAELTESMTGSAALQAARRAGMRARVMKQYVGSHAETGEHVTRLDLVFTQDPFHQESIPSLDACLKELQVLLAEIIPGKTEVHALGSTASIRDMKTTTDRDMIRIAWLVLIGVYLVLVFLLRKPAISAYLIFTVFFSYLATLGVTIAVFWAMDPANFAGIDWKVRMFLFTILIAIGEDYNIFLVTRIDEERRVHNPEKGVRIALVKTGSIISSCGIIMAGTFSSLMAGSLEGMQQLGFALAFGVLLDTFVVRTILVPSYMVLLERGLFGRYSRFFGAIGKEHRPPKKSTVTSV